MKKLKNNRKGMTLVEVVTAMGVLSVASLMIVMALLYTVRANHRNYKRSSDIYDEGVAAETYNVNRAMSSGDAKIQRNNISGNGTNRVTLGVTFDDATLGGINYNISNVYAYKSKLPGKSEDVTYQMQFFQKKSNYSDCVDPTNGKYYLVVYNDSVANIDNWKFTSTDTFQMFDIYNTECSSNEVVCNTVPANGGSAGIGVNFSAGASFSIGGLTINSGNYQTYAEKDADGNDTGMLYVHYTGSGFLNQDQFDQIATTED